MLLGSPRILIAPDKFKGTLTAIEVGECLATGLRSVLGDSATTVMPMADGGDGTLGVAISAGFTPVEVTAADPEGVPTKVQIAVRDRTAVVELARICGLHVGAVRAGRAETASTLGLGLAMRAALEAGFTRLVVGLGGSASTDGGAGMLVGLGARLLDAAGRDVPPSPGNLNNVTQIDLDALTPRLADAELVFAVDVDAPLLGQRGAARVFGPQKGADVFAVERLEQAMAHWAKLVLAVAPRVGPDTPGAGAAGGTGFAGLALGGRLASGSDLCLELAGFAEALSAADFVVTGEGRLDSQTLLGKAPARIAERALSARVPAFAVVGSRAPGLSDSTLLAHGFTRVYTLADQADGTEHDTERSRHALHRVGRRIAEDINQ